jgi:hypothetical protein
MLPVCGMVMGSALIANTNISSSKQQWKDVHDKSVSHSIMAQTGNRQRQHERFQIVARHNPPHPGNKRIMLGLIAGPLF